MFAVVGIPPGKFQAYVKVLDAGAQLLTIAVGFIAAVPQLFAITAIVAVGGCLTSTVCEVLKLPQEFVAVSLMV